MEGNSLDIDVLKAQSRNMEVTVVEVCDDTDSFAGNKEVSLLGSHKQGTGPIGGRGVAPHANTAPSNTGPISGRGTWNGHEPTIATPTTINDDVVSESTPSQSGPRVVGTANADGNIRGGWSNTDSPSIRK